MHQVESHPKMYNLCLRVLQRRGWTLHVERTADRYGRIDPVRVCWIATINEYELYAFNPIELLGLAEIYEHKGPNQPSGPYWWTVDGPNIWDQLIEQAFPGDDSS